MRSIFYTIFCLTIGQFTSFAQIELTTHGSGYALQTYYDIKSGESSSVEILSWDIAFTTNGQGAGVLINEGVPASMGAPIGEIQLYYKDGLTFESQDTSGKVRFFNDEKNWENGAFNTIVTPGNPFNFGWGIYNPQNHSVTGTTVFLLKLRDDSWKKINITSLIAGTMTFEIADINGSNRSIKSFSKSEFAGSTLAYYSFASDSFLDLEPTHWDLLFTRYSTPLDNGGEELNYQVTGTLTNRGIEVVKVTGVDPETVDYQQYISGLSTDNDVIGHDWKFFDLGTFQWSVPQDVAYFVKNGENELWKLNFIDFEGSSTGTVTLQKEFLTVLTSVSEKVETIESFEIFPNPARSTFTLAFEMVESVEKGKMKITNINGSPVHTYESPLNSGLNIFTPQVDLPQGIYFVSLETGKEVFSKKLMIIK